MTTITIAPERKCINGADPDAPCEPYEPIDGVLGDYWEAPDLTAIGRKLISEKFPDFPEDCRVLFLWKAKATSKAIGQTKLLTGELYYAYGGEWDARIWVAADVCRGFSEWQREAVVYHELCHIRAKYDNAGNADGFELYDHEFEGFAKELEEYGFWRESAAVIGAAVQARLEFEDPTDALVRYGEALATPTPEPDALPSADDYQDDDDEPRLVSATEAVVAAMDGMVIEGDGYTATIHAGGPKGKSGEPLVNGNPDEPMHHAFKAGKDGKCKTCSLGEDSALHVERKTPGTEEEAQAQEEAVASLGARAK